MIACMRPLPSAISPGHLRIVIQLRPSSFVSLKYPSSICPAPIASQKPFVDRALNWQGQPHAQLQFTNSVPRIIHLSFMARVSLLAGRHSSYQMYARTLRQMCQLAALPTQASWEKVLQPINQLFFGLLRLSRRLPAFMMQSSGPSSALNRVVNLFGPARWLGRFGHQ